MKMIVAASAGLHSNMCPLKKLGLEMCPPAPTLVALQLYLKGTKDSWLTGLVSGMRIILAFSINLSRSAICVAFSIFTILTFWIETDRFQYPERPIFMLAFCQTMVAIGFLIRVIFGHDHVACDAFKIKGAEDSNVSMCFVVSASFLLMFIFF